MSKTNLTKELEKLLSRKFSYRNDFYVFECTIGWYGSEIVDCIMYNCQREIHCFEIKQSLQDFHSKAKKTFIGNKNYYVMPYSLYEKVKDEIPEEIGVYVAIDHMEEKERKIQCERIIKTELYAEPVDGLQELYCIKSAISQPLKADKEVILSSMLRSMQRDRVLTDDAIEKLVPNDPLSDTNYSYFISYMAIDSFNKQYFNNCEIETNSQLCFDDIESIEDELIKTNDEYKNVKIINYNLIKKGEI